MAINHTYNYLFLLFISCFTPIGTDGHAHATETGEYPNSITMQSANDPDLEKLKNWLAGQTVSPLSIKQFGRAKCFEATHIDSLLFRRIYRKSYKENCSVPIEQLRYLKVLHYDIHGKIHLGELICHQDISQDLLEIFSELYDARYPIERMVLIDDFNAEDEASMQANNTSCFNFRKIAGSRTLSKHSTGHAVDINPLYNPYMKVRNGKTIFQPKTAKKYLERSETFPYKINKGDLCYRLFKKHGFKWGGDWKSVKDFQHFEK